MKLKQTLKGVLNQKSSWTNVYDFFNFVMKILFKTKGRIRRIGIRKKYSDPNPEHHLL